MRRGLSSLLVLAIGLVFAAPLLAKDAYRVYFRDKALTEHDLTPGSKTFEETIAKLSKKSIERRKKSLGVEHDWQTIAEEDFSVASHYRDSLIANGASIGTISNWLNFVSIECDGQAIETISRYPFVKGILKLEQRPERLASILDEACGADTIVFHRGLSAWHLDRINTGPMHWLGIDATGVAIAYFDTGFRWKDNRALDHLNVIAEYDFVFKDSVTADQEADAPIPETHGHGTAVLGVATGYIPDTVIGPAFNANVILGKTEDLRSETPQEEENYAAALEWAESLGADISSVSLGYIFFDSGYVSYTYPDLNGQTAISTRAAARAAKLGMIVVSAMGNAGNFPFPYLNAPADADSIIAVGAMDVNDSIAGFSSRGPASDGRIKPEISAPGTVVWAYNPSAGPFPATGTSHSTPLVSSSVALLVQTHPDATAQEIRRAIMETGSNASTPDTAQGWGMLNTYAAALQLGPFFGRFTQKYTNNVLDLCVGFASQEPSSTIKIKYRHSSGEEKEAELTAATDSLYYGIGLSITDEPGGKVSYYLEAVSGNDTIRLPRNAPTQAYQVTIADTSIVFADVRDKRSRNVQAWVSPNPANTFVEVQSEREIATAELLDNTGRMVIASLSVTEQTKRFILRDVAIGSYFILVTYADGTQESIPVRVVR